MCRFTDWRMAALLQRAGDDGSLRSSPSRCHSFAVRSDPVWTGLCGRMGGLGGSVGVTIFLCLISGLVIRDILTESVFPETRNFSWGEIRHVGGWDRGVLSSGHGLLLQWLCTCAIAVYAISSCVDFVGGISTWGKVLYAPVIGMYMTSTVYV